MKPYIYKVTDKVTGEFYIGSQCRGKVIGKNYFTSSKNKIFKNKFKSNPAQFEIKIIGTFTNPESCVLQENFFIKFYIKNPSMSTAVESFGICSAAYSICTLFFFNLVLWIALS